LSVMSAFLRSWLCILSVISLHFRCILSAGVAGHTKFLAAEGVYADELALALGVEVGGED
jgi:hypothetical protein